MAIQIQGNSGTVMEVSGTGFRAIRMEKRPLEYGVLGSYSLSMLSGTIGAGLAANAEIFQFRWTDSTRLCAVHEVIIDGLGGSATAFAAGFAKVDCLIARSFTAAGTGGATATLTGNNQKLRTAMGSTLLGEARCASTAALGAGTKTLDSQAIGQYAFTVGTTASVQYINQLALFSDDTFGDHPIILTQNEGFVVRATVPATGTWQFGVTVRWTEVASY